MKALESLFGKSPFTPLKNHMIQVSRCVNALVGLLESLPRPLDEIEAQAFFISDLEKGADLIKAQIKRDFDKSLFLSVDRMMVIETLSFQDKIANCCENLAHTLSYGELPTTPKIDIAFKNYYKSCFETFESARVLSEEYEAIICTSFGGSEAERVDMLIEQVAVCQHDAKLKEYQFLKQLYAHSSSMGFAPFYLWQNVSVILKQIASFSEKLAYRMRRMLEKR